MPLWRPIKMQTSAAKEVFGCRSSCHAASAGHAFQQSITNAANYTIGYHKMVPVVKIKVTPPSKNNLDGSFSIRRVQTRSLGEPAASQDTFTVSHCNVMGLFTCINPVSLGRGRYLQRCLETLNFRFTQAGRTVYIWVSLRGDWAGSSHPLHLMDGARSPGRRVPAAGSSGRQVMSSSFCSRHLSFEGATIVTLRSSLGVSMPVNFFSFFMHRANI